MNMVGDMGRYTQFQVGQSLPIAAANEGGGAAGIGVGLGAGMAMAQSMVNAMKPGEQSPPTAPGPAGPNAPAAPTAGSGGPAPAAETKFCINCGHSIPRAAKFCPDCGSSQQ